MRLIRSVVFLLLLTCTGIAGNAQDALSKYEYVKKLFSTLQKKDKEAFVKLFPDLSTFKQLTNEIIGDEEAMVDKVKEINGWTQADYDSLFVPSIQKDFNRAIELAEKRGVDWSTATYITWTEKIEDTVGMGGLKMLSGKIFFISKNKEFELRFEQIVWSANDKHWYGVDLGNVRAKEEANDDDDIGGIKDGINPPVAVDTVYVAPVPAKPVIDAPKKVPAKNKPKKQ